MANIYITGTVSASVGYIRVFDPQGSGTITALPVTCTDALYVSNGGFGISLHVVLDPTNTHLFVADSSLNVIWDINLNTHVATRLAGTGTTGQSGLPGAALSVAFRFPRNMAVDAAGNLYVIDLNNVLCLNRQATTQTILGISIPAGNMAVVAGTYNTANSTGDGGPATAATFCTSPDGNNLALDAIGNLYIADGSGVVSTSHRVRVVNHATGIINNFVGSTIGYSGDGGPYGSALFGNISGICFDPAGNFYAVAYQVSSLRAINLQATPQTLYNWSIASGNIDVIADSALANSSTGNGGQARAATVYQPHALQVDYNGVLYFSEQSPSSGIRAIDPKTGIVTRVAGLGGSASTSGDGGPATSANIDNQYTIAVQQFSSGTPVAPGVIAETQVDAYPTGGASNEFVRFRLRNFAGKVPVATSGVLATITATLDAGSVAQNVIPNTAISPAGTFYTCEIWANGRITTSGNVTISASGDLSTLL